MSQHASFRVNTPSVISEIVDNEAIIVNLDNGAYYSLRDTGCVIWRLLEQGATTAQVVTQLSQQYGGETAVVITAVQQLIAELQAEALVSPCNEAVKSPSLPFIGGDDRQAFTEPVLEKFTDMSDLLLLDPIHDVDAEGWPQT
jgi:hypothetical protein